MNTKTGLVSPVDQLIREATCEGSAFEQHVLVELPSCRTGLGSVSTDSGLYELGYRALKASGFRVAALLPDPQTFPPTRDQPVMLLQRTQETLEKFARDGRVEKHSVGSWSEYFALPETIYGQLRPRHRRQAPTSISPTIVVQEPSPSREQELKRMGRLYYDTPEWKLIRKFMLRLSNHQCSICKSGSRLNVHHKTYEHFGDEWPQDLTVLCRKCHAKFHDKLEDAQ